MAPLNLVRRTCSILHRAPTNVFIAQNSQRCVLPSILHAASFSASSSSQSNSKWAKRFEKEEKVVKEKQKKEEEMNKQMMPEGTFDDTTIHGMHHDSSGDVFDPTLPGREESGNALTNKIYHKYKMLAQQRKLKQQDPSGEKFDKTQIAREAQRIFIDFNNELQRADSWHQKPKNRHTSRLEGGSFNNSNARILKKTAELKLLELATLNMVDAMKEFYTKDAERIYWRYDKEVESPKVVNLTLAPDAKEEYTAQVTVELNTMQIRAVRDKYERILKGCVQTPVHVTNYILLEKFLSNPYAKWRICGHLNQPEK